MHNGIFSVRVRCRLLRPCVGAFLVLQTRPTAPTGAPEPMKDWVAGSDLTVPARATASVDVGLTKVGERLAGSRDGYRGLVSVQLLGYGFVSQAAPPPRLLLHG